MNYFKLLLFYAINFIDSIINLLCAIVHYYPTLEFAQEYLLRREIVRVSSEVQNRQDRRVDQLHKADSLVAEAKKLDEQD